MSLKQQLLRLKKLHKTKKRIFVTADTNL